MVSPKQQSSVLAVYDYVSRLRIGGDHFHEIVENLKIHQIDKARFLTLQRSELVELGLTDTRKRHKLYAHLHRLRQKRMDLYLNTKSEKINNAQNAVIDQDDASNPQYDLISPWSDSMTPSKSLKLSKSSGSAGAAMETPSETHSNSSANSECGSVASLNVPSPTRMSPLLMEEYSEKIKCKMSPSSRELMEYIQRSGSITNSVDGEWNECIDHKNNDDEEEKESKFNVNIPQSPHDSMNNALTPMYRVTVNAPKSNKMKTDNFQMFRCVRSSKDSAKFMGILRHCNRRKQVFVLIQEDHALQFNTTVDAWEKQQKSADADYGNGTDQMAKRCTPEALQQFQCKCLSVVRKENGWKIMGILFPFNPVCVFSYSFSKGGIDSITPLETEGIIRDQRVIGPYHTELWMQSRTRVSLADLDHLGNIGRIRFIDDHKYQFTSKDTWYKKHDLDQNPQTDRECRPWMKVTFCLALHIHEARHQSPRRRISVRTWNVKPKMDQDDYHQNMRDQRAMNRQRIRDAVTPKGM